MDFESIEGLSDEEIMREYDEIVVNDEALAASCLQMKVVCPNGYTVYFVQGRTRDDALYTPGFTSPNGFGFFMEVKRAFCGGNEIGTVYLDKTGEVGILVYCNDGTTRFACGGVDDGNKYSKGNVGYCSSTGDFWESKNAVCGSGNYDSYMCVTSRYWI